MITLKNTFLIKARTIYCMSQTLLSTPNKSLRHRIVCESNFHLFEQLTDVQSHAFTEFLFILFYFILKILRMIDHLWLRDAEPNEWLFVLPLFHIIFNPEGSASKLVADHYAELTSPEHIRKQCCVFILSMILCVKLDIISLPSC